MKTNYMNTEDTSDYEYGYIDNALVNKGAIMLWNMVYAVDLEDLAYAYYAGILGKSSKNLPVYFSGKNPMYSSSLILPKDFNWTLDSDGFPTEMKVMRQKDELDRTSFKW